MENFLSSGASQLKTTIVQAGAGTGKTQSLALKIIETARAQYTPEKGVPRFVATTFTERATSELRERVVSLLADQEDAPEWLKDFVQDTENLHISTIHGTLSLFLHRYGSLLGLDPEFTILKASEERDLLSLVIRKVIAEEQSLSLILDHYSFNELIDMAKKLIPHYRLHKENLKAAKGWREIFQKEVNELFGALEEISTLTLTATGTVMHPKGDLPPKAAETLNTLNRMFGALRAEKDLGKVREAFLATMEGIRKPSSPKLAGTESALEVIFKKTREAWKKDKYSTEINERHDEITPFLERLIAKVAEDISIQKRERGLMSFDDLEFLSHELVLKHPEILNSWRKEWDFWFIDEFQDTSPLQKNLLFSFFRTPWNAYFVGDPQQSIYLFRGADENVFQDTKKIVAARGGSLEKLETNYRSDPDLLRFLNLVFSKFKNPIAGLKARGPENGKIRAQIHIATKEVDETNLIIHQVMQWRKLGISFQDIAILVTKNSKARLIGQKMGQLGIPVYIHSSGGFYDRREILDALALLSFIEDPSDDDTFILLSRSPWIGVKDGDLAQWGTLRKKLTFWDWLKTQSEIKTANPNLNLLEKAITDAEVLPLSLVYSQALEALGFWEFCLVDDSSGRREANLRKLLWTLKKAEEKPDFSASTFIDEAWQEILDSGEETEAASFVEPERVNIMTVHKSKGLKFNCVIVPHCGEPFRTLESALELSPDGRWSTRVLSLDSEEKVGPLVHGQLRDERVTRELAESLRVFYVALTRAAERLSIIGKNQGGETSWLSQLAIPLTEGDHEKTYAVKNWIENPINEKIESLLPEKLREKIDLRIPTAIQKISQLTVTHLVQNRVSEVSLPIERQLESQQRGQAIHYIFENLKNSKNLESLCELARKRFAVVDSIDPKLVNETLALKNPPLKALIENGKTEWPFVIRENEVTLRGQIDLWGTVEGLTWIVDYKSSRKFKEESVTRAKEQLELYALAIHKTGIQWNDIRLAIVAPLQAEAKVLELSSLIEVKSRLKPQVADTLTEAEI
jgi:ATP-dependent helicase/nuclease subunit A